MPAPATQSWAARHLFHAACVALLVLQIGFWNMSKNVHPDMEIVPSVPGKKTVEAIAFGDKEFFFRGLALNIQTFGDTFGRFTALYKYDFSKLYRWFLLADALDNQSDMIPTLASYYFSQSQHAQDNVWTVRYLEQYSKDRLKTKWWWQAQAAYIAEHKLKDRDWALKLALPLQQQHDIPFWAQQLAAFIYEKKGEFESALEIMENIKQHAKEIPQGELNFMRYFVEERLKALDAADRQRALHEFPPQRPITAADTQKVIDGGKGDSSALYRPDTAVPRAVNELYNEAK